MRRYEIIDEIYGQSFTLFTLSNLKDGVRFYKLYPGTLEEITRNHVAFLATIGEGGREFEIVVLKPGWRYTDLVHEVVHHAVGAFRDIGASIEAGHDEPFAYYVEYILRKCLKAMAKRKVKLKTGTRSKNMPKTGT